jgi:predicted AlkP superfamily pyrophosphatase or phosphodiesterase
MIQVCLSFAGAVAMRIALCLLAPFLFLSPATIRAAEPEKPKLLVLIVFDQMRGDYLDKWKELFGNDGFRRLQKDGAWFTNCHYPYATTTTGPGHASILTGTTPDQHGIAQNEWYDRKTAKIINCSESPRYQRVPPLPKAAPKDELIEEPKKASTQPAVPTREKTAGMPEYLLAPTVGDALKEATGGRARVVGLSFKDRSALLPVGKKADAVYWLDSTDGLIVTSTYYRDSVHAWVGEFNKKRVPDQWFDKPWTRLRSDIDYAKYSGPDQGVGEGVGSRQGVVFPHAMHGGLKKPGKAYYDALFNSPFGNDFLFELVKTAIVAEELGKDDVTDLLAVSFSSNDAIGHVWGPDSQEVLDVTLRSDRMMAEFLTFLDKHVGKAKYLLAITADHGVCPIPEYTAKSGTFAKRISARWLFADAEDFLTAKFNQGKPLDPKGELDWIEYATTQWIYLNRNVIDALGLKPADVERALADFLSKQEGIERAMTRADLAKDIPDTDPIGQRVKRSYYPERCGDVAVVVKPYCLLTTTTSGTSHGQPHAYDTHVPLVIYGPGIKAGTRKELVTPQATAAIFAAAAGIKPPKMASYPVPPGLFEK